MSDINLNYSGEQLDEAIGKVLDDYADVSEVDAGAEDVLSGKKFVNSSGEIVEGLIVGTEGPPGTDGEDGLSAYEVAVTNGFIGSEVEWLASLKGDTGEKGEPGIDGIDGDDNVYIGTTPPIDESINIWINPSGEAGLDIVVVDNLTSTSSTAALSAAQGKVLYDLIGDVETLMAAI